MEKRKLAQIPREEATDEMVRFAERAAGTHIVTTRDIEKDLLMMTFYPIDKLKKGEKSAQLRTFFSKNDYISQDLTAERVKWLTAAFDRMECIHLYEYHWDRDKGNRYTPNMFFWTDADIDRMRGFFKEWSTEKDVKDWTAVTRFQDMVKQRRLDEKHAKETNPIDTVMGTVKEIPEDFKKWVSEKAMSFSRYLVYSTRSKNEALVFLYHLNQTVVFLLYQLALSVCLFHSEYCKDSLQQHLHPAQQTLPPFSQPAYPLPSPVSQHPCLQQPPHSPTPHNMPYTNLLSQYYQQAATVS